MQELNIAFWLFVATFLNAAILYFIIKWATKASLMQKKMHLQNKILLHLAKKLEVDEQTVQQLNNYNNTLV